MEHILNKAQTAKALGITPRWLGELEEKGLPREGRGKYDLLKVNPWYIEYQKELVKNEYGQDGSIAKERARNLKIQADRNELRLKKERDELIEVEAVRAVFGGIFIEFRTRMMELPDKVAAVVLAKGDQPSGAAEVDNMFRALLKELSMLDVDKIELAEQ